MFLDIDKKKPDSLAAIDDSGRQLSYGGLAGFCHDFRTAIGNRTLIIILSENCIGSFAAYVASLSERIVPLILNCNTDHDLLNKLLDIYRPAYVWVPDRLTKQFPYKTTYSCFDYSLMATCMTPPALFEELSLLLPTSGSLAGSKLVRHTYRNVEANARNVAALFELTENDRALAMLPMHFTMGLSVITSHIFAGATVLLVKKNLLDKDFWLFFREQRASSFTGVPYSFEVLHRLRFLKMDFPCLKVITQGGGKLCDELFRAFAEYAASKNIKFIATYGQTEGTARMAYLPAGYAISKTGSIGKAIPNGELFIVDEDLRVIEQVETMGQLVYKGENVTLGYAFCAGDLSKGDENNGVLVTGDIARRDKDGFYYIIGRKSRFLKLYGMRIGLDECEQMIRAAYNTECACVGDDTLMTVFITEADYVTKIRDFLIRKVNLIADAFRVQLIDEIPKNETGKIVYRKLLNYKHSL